MEQISLFGNGIYALNTFEDVDLLLSRVREGETADDLFSWNAIINGRSYSIYGTKVFEFYPNKNGNTGGKLNVSPEILKIMGIDAKKFSSLDITTEAEMEAFVEALKTRKHYLFRNLITEAFACCNDFLLCSDAEKCIHQDDRFYNGCTYRTHLEQGRIFYGPKRNID